jgi:hypothetical protein
VYRGVESAPRRRIPSAFPYTADETGPRLLVHWIWPLPAGPLGDSRLPCLNRELSLHVIMHPGQITEHGDPLLAPQQICRR